MNQIAAMAKTLEAARAAGMDNITSDNSELDFPHLQDMYDRVIASPADFSEAKLGRWLGWMQAAVVAAGVGLSLDTMKAINQSEAD